MLGDVVEDCRCIAYLGGSLMRKFVSSLVYAGVCLGFVACSTTTIRPQGTQVTISEPSYKASEDFYFWGLMGEYHVHTNEVCKSKSVQQMQTQFTVPDALLGLVTLGIYSPRTIKVWCGA